MEDHVMVDPGRQEKPIGKSAAPRALLSKNKWALSKTNASISTPDAQATLMEGHVTIEYGPLVRCSGKNVALHALLSKSKIKTKETKISVSISTTDALATFMEGHVMEGPGLLVRSFGMSVVPHAWQFNQETITIKAHPFQQLTTFLADVMVLMTHMQSVPNM
jgi:hypothetical protein